MARKREVWTKRCQDGRACGHGGAPRHFVPDDVDICDGCLKTKYGLWLEEMPDEYRDPSGIGPGVYSEEFVLKLARRIEELERRYES